MTDIYEKHCTLQDTLPLTHVKQFISVLAFAAFFFFFAFFLLLGLIPLLNDNFQVKLSFILSFRVAIALSSISDLFLVN
jgi:hypothetical protein